MRQGRGDLHIESKAGAITIVDLVLRRAAPQAHSNANKSRAGPMRSSGRAPPASILLSDDDSVRAAMAELSRYDGHTVVEASSGQADMDGSQTTHTGVALIEYMMPGRNRDSGKARELTPSFPIFFVSVYADTKLLQGVVQATILRRPVDTQELLVGFVARKARAAKPNGNPTHSNLAN